METYFVPNYFVERDYNENILDWWERVYVADRASYRVGPARIRQVRNPYGRDDDVITWKHFPHYWPFMQGIQQ